jgi:hypothetical protein
MPLGYDIKNTNQQKPIHYVPLNGQLVSSSYAKQVQQPVNKKASASELDNLKVSGLRAKCLEQNIPIKSNMKRQDYISAILKK